MGSGEWNGFQLKTVDGYSQRVLVTRLLLWSPFTLVVIGGPREEFGVGGWGRGDL